MINAADADIAALAPLSNTRAGQKALLTALRARVAQQHNIVEDTKARDTEIAAQLRALAYPPRDGKTSPDDQIIGDPNPSGPKIQQVDNTMDPMDDLFGPQPVQPLPPAPPGKEWHYYAFGGWRLEDALKPGSGQKEFWLSLRL